ncbi:helix-turn-helix domain-containing protein [Streptomyces sp. SS7]|uniref:nSTAND1 domain-containing NTPase n=1 Tax=Streptomyces sp. SS7 TaxID=3108485 RepID=UPI0030EB49AF
MSSAHCPACRGATPGTSRVQRPAHCSAGLFRRPNNGRARSLPGNEVCVGWPSGLIGEQLRGSGVAGRREVPVDPGAGPVQRFAYELRKLRAEAGGLTYRVLAQRAGYAVTTLSQAAAGEQLPTLPVVLAYAQACGGDRAEWEARWRRAVDEAAASGPGVDEESGTPPYRGLARFELGDSGRFFGRDKLTAELFDVLRKHRCAAVFGASGSGKSSLLRAGLIPALQHTQDLALRPAAIRILTPGRHPARTHAQVLDTGPGTESAQTDVFVIVDQFEEVFTLCHDPAERADFIDLLLTARRPESRLRVLLAVRADFYGRCAEHRGLADTLRDANVLVGPMSPAELRQAIVKPAVAEGLTVERALTARLVDEVADAPGGLPLLSHVLWETWRRRRGKTMTLTGYEAAGGLEGAVAKTAEDVYGRFTTAQAAAARRLLLRLVTPGDGTPDTRRPTQHAELRDIGGEETAGVLESLARARLLTLDDDTVELAHEALLTAWPRLRRWIDAERERLRDHRKLAEAARTWEDLGRDAGALYRGARLATAREHFGSAPAADLTRLEHAFLTASLTAREQEEQATARTNRRLRALTTSLSVLLVLAVTAGLLAWQQSRLSDQQKRNADRARQVALSRQLAAQSSALLGTNSDLAALLAVQAYRTSATSQATESLYAAAAVPLEHRLTGQRGVVSSVAFSPDGRTLATGSTSGDQLWLWDTRTGRLSRTFNGQGEAAALVAFSPDGQNLTTAGNFGHSVDLWNVTTGHTRINALASPEAAGREDQWPATEAFTRDGRILAVGREDGTLRLWDTRTGRVRRTLAEGARAADGEATAGVTSIAFSADGRTLASGSEDRTVRLWDTGTGRLRTRLAGDPVTVASLALTPDGRILAVGGEDGTLRLWDTRTGRVRETLAEGARAADGEATAGVTSIAFSPDGRTLASGSEDRTVRLWDTGTGRLRRSLAGHAHIVGSLAFSPDGRTLASGDDDGSVRLWDMTPGASESVLADPRMQTDLMVFSPDGSTLATANHGGRTVHVWDVAARRLRASVAVPTSEAGSMVFSPDAGALATASIYGLGAYLWDTRTGSLRVRLDVGAAPPVNSVAFSPDGRTLATATTAIGVQLWNAATGGLRRNLEDDTATVTSVAFSADGRMLATGSEDGTVRLWDPGTHRRLKILPGNSSAVTTLRFSPDGRTLATGGVKDRTVQLWDTASGTSRASLAGYSGEAGSVAFTPDSRVLAIGAPDGTVRLWDTATGSALATLTGHTNTVLALVFGSDGHTLLTAGADRTVRRWNIAVPPPDTAISRICRAIGRDLTSREHSVYLPDQSPHPTCLH